MAPRWFSGAGKHFRSGEAFFDNGQLCEALEEFSKAIELDTRHAESYLCRGASYRELGQYGNAVADFDKAIILKPESAFAFTVRGSSYYVFGEHRKALADFEKAIGLEPRNALAFCCRGFLNFALKKYREAIEDFNKALEPNPEDFHTNSSLFRASPYAKPNSELTKPAPLLGDKTISFKHDDADAYCTRGKAYMELYRHKEAVADYDRVIELNPEKADAYLYRAMSHEKLDSILKAFEDYDKAIELNLSPAVTALVYLRRGVLYGEFKEYGKAASDLAQAEALGCASEHIRMARLRMGI